jgi:hypothetical protein
MCDDHGVTRRGFLRGAGAATAAGILLPAVRLPRRLPLGSAARPVARDGSRGYSMAMHIHSSFSEQNGSMDAQLYQATQNAVDVCWFTDHDARLDGFDYRDVVHFTSLTSEQGGKDQGKAWHWTQQESGPLSNRNTGGGIVQYPRTPNDPAPHGSLNVNAQSTNSSAASFGFYANSSAADYNYRDNLTGQSLSIDILLNSGWRNGYLELEIKSSYHEASGGRPAGNYTLSYRFVPAGQGSADQGSGQRGGRNATGNLGVVTIPVTPARPGDWMTATITPSFDIGGLWPDLDYRDFALWQLTLSAVSTGDAVSGYFDYLRFERTKTGGELFTQQQSMMQGLAIKYPKVVQLQGLECSWSLPHCNWFGPGIAVPTYQGVDPTPESYHNYLKDTVLPGIHQAGGLYSYNHPFGTKSGPLLPASEQAALSKKVAAHLLPSACFDADLLEVGYPVRGHCGIGTHLGLWDVFSRNAIFLTGNGTSDNHSGESWQADPNNWITSAWSASTSMTDLTAAMAAGQLWCGSLIGFGPGSSLNLEVDGDCPMGSVSLSPASSRRLTVYATGVPSGGQVQVVQGAVDYAGTRDPVPNSQVIASFPASQLPGGQASLTVDTTRESFVRTVVADRSGTIVGASNPAWLLHKAPPRGIPRPRQA